jgi:hypothetical protein
MCAGSEWALASCRPTPSSDDVRLMVPITGYIPHIVFLTQRCKGPQRDAEKEDGGMLEYTPRSSLENEVSAFAGIPDLTFVATSKRIPAPTYLLILGHPW